MSTGDFPGNVASTNHIKDNLSREIVRNEDPRSPFILDASEREKKRVRALEPSPPHKTDPRMSGCHQYLVMRCISLRVGWRLLIIQVLETHVSVHVYVLCLLLRTCTWRR